MKAIRKAGLQLIYKHGYEAMNLRELASEVGIRAGSLYNHISSKQELLFILIRDHLEDVHRAAEKSLGGINEPVERLRAFINFHGTYHMHKKREVYISNFELRNLEPKNYATIVALRSLHEHRLKAILDEGVARGVFQRTDTRIATLAILAMLTGVCVWYRSSGRLSKQEIIDIHMNLVFQGILPRGAVSPDEYASVRSS